VIETGTSEELKVLHIGNCTEEPVTIYPNTTLGTCISVKENESVQITSCSTKTVGEQTSCEALPEYLGDLFMRSSVHLKDTDQNLLKELLIKYQSVFAKSSLDLGFSDRVEHHIDTMGAEPIKEPMRRLPLAKQKIEREEVHKMLQAGVIEPSVSPWSSNIVLITKKDGSTRFCVDYRKVNLLTKKDSYPLPNISQCLDALAGSVYFNCMDINSGYWQIGVAKEDREKTAFATSMGLFQFVKMPFGLVAAPSEFCRLMGDVFRDLQWVECILYMDDIIVPAKTVEESLLRLEHVFQRLQSANLKLKASKCVFFQKSVKFLGHEVSEQGVHTDKDKIKAIQEWPVPRTAKQTRSFIGLAAYYKRFIASFGEICKPLYQLSEKNRKFVWTNDCQYAFDTLKEKLSTAPILAYPVLGKDFILDTDASQFTVGAILSQEYDGKERVVAYMSKTMNKHELQYCTTRKELLAVVTALKHFHHYLLGQTVKLRTDNSAVSWIRTLKNPSGQVFRWLQYIETYDISVTHRPGKSHGNADALSRIPCKVCQRQEQNEIKNAEEHDPELLEDNSVSDQKPSEEVSRAVTRGQQQNEATAHLKPNQFLLAGWEPSTVRHQQLSDPVINPIMVAVESQSRPEWHSISETTSHTKTLWRQWDRLIISSGMLYRKWVTDELRETKYQLVVPQTLQHDILTNYHDIPSAGHLGTDKMLSRIQDHFYWPAMRDKIDLYCRQCDNCQSRKPAKLTRAPLGQDPVSEPMEKVTLDILGPLPVTERANRFILVISDCFTKWTECVPLPDQEAATIATAFVNNFITRFGTPLLVLTDGGTNFESKLFREVCKFLQIEKVKTSVMRPQANGVTERLNRTLASMLTMFCVKDQKDWDRYLPQVMMAYRSSVHASTKYSPNQMVYGKQILLPMAAVVGQPKEENPIPMEDYVQNLQEKLTQIHTLA
ncbi:MAG: DDE-type integrase/transposase/recombinase, partial [Candidatus Thiodiazotropha taylori]|nr:DDE-type integrase/transposase/recombinase [Candidatus Thiodiazotropha taylori]MCW4335126.1 RNase H-like domain-containing protein [Candidatus Thiodiazotropha endolucinida]